MLINVLRNTISTENIYLVTPVHSSYSSVGFVIKFFNDNDLIVSVDCWDYVKNEELKPDVLKLKEDLTKKYFTFGLSEFMLNNPEEFMSRMISRIEQLRESVLSYWDKDKGERPTLTF